MKTNQYDIYVDGSFINGNCSYGAIILQEGKEIESLSGRLSDQKSLDVRQVSGELEAVKQSLIWCSKNKIDNVTIYYDYKGIECWATGQWRAKKDITKEYVIFIKNCKINITFKKVAAHSGDLWNEKVDKLAKSAALSGKTNKSTNENLEKLALNFCKILIKHNIDSKFDKIYNSMYARIEIYYFSNTRNGMIDIYKTQKKNYTIDLRGFKDNTLESEIKELYKSNKDILLSKF